MATGASNPRGGFVRAWLFAPLQEYTHKKAALAENDSSEEPYLEPCTRHHCPSNSHPSTGLGPAGGSRTHTGLRVGGALADHGNMAYRLN
jgi:hypothetical protein